MWLIVAWLAAGCAGRAAELPCAADPRCLRYGMDADIPILDPHSAEQPAAGAIFRQIYDTLVYRDSDSHEFAPGLAQSWQVSADGLVYTFALRRDILFHDGSAFNAAAVARNIQRIYDPQTAPALARELLGPLSQYEIVDDYTLRLHLSAPYPALLDGLSQPYLGIASPRALDEYGALRYQFHQAGTGPFVLEAYTPGERALLRRNADYRVNAPIYAPLQGDEIQRVEVVIGRRAAGDALTLLDEALDVIDQIAPGDAQTLAGNSRVQILPAQVPALAAGFLINTALPPMDEPGLRRALLLATDLSAISDRYTFTYAPVAWSPLSRSTGFAHTGYAGSFAPDMAGARELIAAAGYADSDGDGIVERSASALSLRMVVPPWGQLAQAAAWLRGAWRGIGIDLQLEPVPGRARLNELVQTGAYHLLPIEVGGIDPVMLGRVFGENAPYRASRAPHERMNTLLIQAQRETDAQLRRNLYYEIQALLMNETLLLPLYEPVRLTAMRSQVRTLRFDAYGLYPLLRNVALAEGSERRNP